MDLPRGFLALPADRSVERLRRKVRLLALRRLLLADVPSAPLSRLQEVLARLARGGPTGSALLAAIGRVDVLVPLLCLEGELGEPMRLLGQLVPTLLTDLSRRLPRGTLRESLLWDVATERIVDPPRLISLAPPGQGLLLEPSGLEARTAEGVAFDPRRQAPAGVREEIALHSIIGELSLSLVDTNPLALIEDHPEKGGNALDLGGHEPDAWCTALREALALIELALPQLYAELITTVERVVPVGYEPERHLSASYREAPGLIYLTLHPSPLTLAEALVHESQHGKLNLLRWFDPVLENGTAAWSPSPVRPDLRPLLGVLMAVHAFVPVAALHLGLADLDHPVCRTPHFTRRRAEVLAANASGLSTLADVAVPTSVGRRVLDALNALHTPLLRAAPPVEHNGSIEALG